jgi:hypothetical protein
MYGTSTYISSIFFRTDAFQGLLFEKKNYEGNYKLQKHDKKTRRKKLQISSVQKLKKTAYSLHTEVYRELPAAVCATNNGRCCGTLRKSEIVL